MFSTICALCCERQGQKRNYVGGQVKFAGAAPGGESDDSTRQPGSGRSHASLSSNAQKSFLENVLPEAFSGTRSFGGEGQNSPRVSQAEESKELKRTIKELQAIAKRLEGPVQKFPRSGKGLFKKMQDRYIAVIQGEDAKGSDDDAHELALWKSGQLAYWDDAAAFKKGAAPKGFVSCLKIAKVWVSKDDSRNRSVVVKHKKGDEMQELVLCFATKRDAEEWSYKLWEFISKLRGHSMGQVGTTYCAGGSSGSFEK